MTIDRVPVSGGSIAVETHTGTTEPILVVHGVSGQRMLWGWLHTEAPHLTLVAPDLRGRGDSVDVEGPSSLTQHAEDLDAVVDALDVDAVHVCGMSMGGFVAVEFAARFPSRVKSLVLVDGGVPVGPPAGLTRENVEAVFADKIARTQQRWNNVDDYIDLDPIELQWNKTRWRCREDYCPRYAIGDAARSVSEVAAAHRVSWTTAHRRLVALAAQVLAEPEPVRVLGIDETRRGKPRWDRCEKAVWDHCSTSIPKRSETESRSALTTVTAAMCAGANSIADNNLSRARFTGGPRVMPRHRHERVERHRGEFLDPGIAGSASRVRFTDLRRRE